MGSMTYGWETERFEFDDRVLAHLRVVIVTKLRRRESFTFTWNLPAMSGSGRVSLWMDPAIPLQFRFSGGREPALNRAWIEALASVAASTTGLIPLPEPDPGTPAADPQVPTAK